jgi:tetratricopeptide (TPR) repeat protein
MKKVFLILLIFCILSFNLFSKENLLENYGDFFLKNGKYSEAKSKYNDSKDIIDNSKINEKIEECNVGIRNPIKKVAVKVVKKEQVNKNDDKNIVKKSNDKKKVATKKKKRKKRRKLTRKERIKYAKYIRFLKPYEHHFKGKNIFVTHRYKIIKFMQKGQLFTAERKFEKAKKYFNEIFKYDKTSVIAYNNLGMLFNTWEKYNKATIYFNDALTIDPNNIESQKYLARSYYFMKDYKKAYKALKNIDVNDKAVEEEVLVDLGKYAILAGEFEFGIENLEKLYKKYKNNNEIIRYLAIGYEKNNKLKDSANFYKKLERVMGYEKVSIIGQLSNLLKLGNLKKALKISEKTKVQDREIDYLKAKIYFENSDYEKSLPICNSLVNLEYKKVNVLKMLINMEINTQSIKSSESYLVELEKLDPYSDATFYLKGLYLNHQSKFEDAEESLLKSVSINDKNIDALYELGLTYKYRYLTAETIQTFESLLVKSPNYKYRDRVEEFLNKY